MDKDYQALHLQLQDLLAAYADKALDEQEIAQVEAHLAGCEACRLDVARQELLSQRLNTVSAARLSTKQHKRLDKVLESAPAPTKNVKQKKLSLSFLTINKLSKYLTPTVVGVSGWSVSLILVVILLFPHLETTNTNIPMVQDVLAEYQQLSKTSFAALKQEQLSTPPATWENAHILASWKTHIGGAPADAFAVRNGNNIVLQFRVNEAVFFHNPKVRLAVANIGHYQTQDKRLKVLALPLQNAGLLMVASKNGMPAPDTLMINSI